MNKFLVFFFFCSALFAGEAALYDLAPEGSSFVRLINIQQDPVELKIEKKRIIENKFCNASDYIYFPAGSYSGEISGMTWQADFLAEATYSVVVNENKITVIQEEKLENRRKGLLVVYNFSDIKLLSVQTTVGARPVLDYIQQNSFSSRAVNPIKIALSVMGEDNVLETGDIIFQSAMISSLFVCSENNKLASRWHQINAL